MAKNAISLSQTKIKSYSDKNGNLAGAHNEHLKRTADNKKTLENELNANRQLRTNTQTNLDNLQAGRTYADTELAFTTGIRTNETKLNNITNAINALKSALQTHYVRGPHPDIVNADALADWLEQVENGLAQATVPTTMPKPAGIMVQGTLLPSHVARIGAEWGNIQTYRTDLNKNQKDLNDLVNGKQIIDEMNQRIPEQEAEFANWDTTHTDKMEELIKYWNMLETGRNTKTGPMYNWFRNLSQKNAEKRFANDRAGIIARYNASHSIAA
jgi:DNA repair exonuclease SbcCD ATPase subunit